MGSDKTTTARTDVNAVIEIAVQLAVVALLAVWCFRIIQPFILIVIWAIIIAVALYPVFAKFKAALGGRTKLAATLFTLIALAIVLVPTFFIAGSLVDTARELSMRLEQETLEVPPPPANVRDWPLVGESLYESWQLASINLEQAMQRYEPQLRALLRALVGFLSGIGGAVVQSVLSLLIAGLFLGTAQRSGDAVRSIGGRLGGDMGARSVDMAGATIRSVAQGVIGVALVQGLLAALGLFLAGVPAAGLWTLFVVVLAVVQLPPILVLAPIIIYVFSTADGTAGPIVFTIWSLIVSGSDAFLKPLFLGRGLDVPMPVILIGAIGGMLLHGVIGLFVGAVVLAIGHSLFSNWLRAGEGVVSPPQKA